MNKRQRKKRALKPLSNRKDIGYLVKYRTESISLKVKKMMRAVNRGDKTYTDFLKVLGYNNIVSISGNEITVTKYVPSSIINICVPITIGFGNILEPSLGTVIKGGLE